jgi:hypothetical protein
VYAPLFRRPERVSYLIKRVSATQFKNCSKIVTVYGRDHAIFEAARAFLGAKVENYTGLVGKFEAKQHSDTKKSEQSSSERPESHVHGVKLQ